MADTRPRGTVTRPKLIEPFQRGRAMASSCEQRGCQRSRVRSVRKELGMAVSRDPAMKRRPIDRVFGVPPAALSAQRRRAAITLPRPPRMGWPDLDEVLAP